MAMCQREDSQREQNLRRWLAQQLRLPDVPDDEWEELVHDCYVSDVFSAEDEEEFEQLRCELVNRWKLIRERRRDWVARQSTKKETEPSPPVPPSVIPLHPREIERARLVSNALGRDADALPPVRRFRAQWFDGELVEYETARRVLRQFAGSSSGQRDAAFSELMNLAEWLTTRYPWDIEGAALFVLSGVPPWIEPIRAQSEATDYGSHVAGRITLEIEPWVSDDTVKRAYRSVQAWTLAKDNRPVEERALTVFQFVSDRLNHNQKPHASWQAIHDEWEREHGARPRHHFSDPYKLKRAYDNVMARMLTPNYRGLGFDDEAVPRGQARRVRFRNLPLEIVQADDHTQAPDGHPDDPA